MTDPTIQRGATNFNTSGSTTLTLFNVQTETVRKSANLIPFPLPTTDSDETLVFDLLGVTREITIRGTFTSEDDADLWKFADDLNGLIQGQQGDTGSSQIGYVYTPRVFNDGDTPPATVTIRVYVNDVSMDYIAGEPNSLSYSVTLMEVSSSSA